MGNRGQNKCQASELKYYRPVMKLLTNEWKYSREFYTEIYPGIGTVFSNNGVLNVLKRMLEEGIVEKRERRSSFQWRLKQ